MPFSIPYAAPRVLNFLLKFDLIKGLPSRKSFFKAFSGIHPFLKEALLHFDGEATHTNEPRFWTSGTFDSFLGVLWPRRRLDGRSGRIQEGCVPPRLRQGARPDAINFQIGGFYLSLAFYRVLTLPLSPAEPPFCCPRRPYCGCAGAYGI